MNRQLQIDQFALLAHQLAFEKLKAEPRRLNEVVQVLSSWKPRNGVTRADHLLTQWQVLLAGSMAQLEQVITAATDKATLLRSVSPMSVLITPLERTRLLKKVRDIT